MKSVKDRMRFEFIPNELYDKLENDDFGSEVKDYLLKYRELYRLSRMKEKRINNLTKKLEEQKELLREMKRGMKDISPFLEHLKDDFDFNCSIVGFMGKGKKYYNITISRNKDFPKNCSLGNEETIKKHLLEYYKGNRKSVSEIKKDWKGFLKYECNYGDTYTKIMEMIMDNPLGFKNLTINRNTLFPLS